ncbi:recombinase family protein [Phenylobacterium sp. VNQ135]|uniref:recombinase family protein n=1 Tax=Phenylobacterium sp. VNQ135 TaxID=3400922 RepID=UPI003BFE58CB
MLKIGYVRLGDEDANEQIRALEALGCQVVRTEAALAEGPTAPVLISILDFIGAGDQLVVNRLEELATTSHALLDIVARLEARGATLYVADAEISSQGEGGRALRAVLQAVGALEPEGARGRRGSPAEVQQIRALKRAGVGPVEIARRLGVSRMTVWRKLRELDAHN